MTGFKGFPKKLTGFLSELEKNNTVAWFSDHKDDYDTFVKHPSEEFVSAMGEELQKIIEALISEGYGMGTKYYKKNPKDFSPSTGFEKEYLLYGGLSTYMEFPIPDILFSPGITDFTRDHFEKINPLHRWIVKYL